MEVLSLGNSRWRPERQFRKGGSITRGNLDAILNGDLTLVELKVPPQGIQSKQSSTKYNVRATFCEVDWSLQQQNPSAVPMFRDLRGASRNCKSTETMMDFWDVVQAAKRYDAASSSSSSSEKASSIVQPIPPTGVVFHETRCGSTLFANLMAAFSPQQSRVYSESPPPVAAIKACDDDHKNSSCNPELHSRLIQDTFYMMGRRRRTASRVETTPQSVFYKIQSIGSMHIDKFAQAMPDVPWVFLYRDTVEIMQSHLSKSSGGALSHRAVCARNYDNVLYQPKTTKQVITNAGRQLKDLSLTQYCAAHLAGLSLSAVQEHERTGRGRFVNYKQMPDVVWNDIFPNYFKIPITAAEIGRMEAASQLYSKGRGAKSNQEWKDDVKAKQDAASPAVIQAADVFTKDVFHRMEELSKRR
ncbi:MAG: hypothetical protein SGILL_004709 [Bacillariaceae sp.]